MKRKQHYNFSLTKTDSLSTIELAFKKGLDTMVTHDIENHKFKIENPEGESYLEYSLEESSFTVLHTIVPDALSGKGLAGLLANEAFTWASKNNYEVKSECSYMTAWLKRKGIKE